MMFSPATEASQEVAVASGTAHVATRFVWPHGGRRVFLTGSFTRWSEHLPMSPIEGCPNMFQVICSLTPGFHQFKFFVDGEWRHDENRSSAMGNYGVVNTIFVAREPEPERVPVLSSPGAPNRINMDVDNQAFQCVDTVAQGPMNNTIHGFSEADLLMSRDRISVFLSTHPTFDLFPESGKVIALDVNLPVKQAFHILHEQGIPVAPLWDGYNGQFVGMLSASDFILILKELGNHGSNLTEEEHETHTIFAWKKGKHHLYGQMDEQGPLQRHLVHAGPFDSLKDVALKIVQNDVSTVPIIYSSSQDGSFPQLLHLASLSGILKCICRHFQHSSGSLPILHQPICMLPLGTWVPQIGDPNGRPLAMLKPTASLNSALSLLVEAQVSAIPVVDNNDSLIDIYSRSDITSVAKDKAYARVRLEEISIHQALQLGQDVNSPYGLSNGQRCQMCLRSDPLLKVMEWLANPGVRRVVVVEAGSKRVEGIITLSDVFRFLLS